MKKYNVLITSGGLCEKIDDVRFITNISTGKLGSIISQKFIEKNHNVTLVTTKTAVLPDVKLNRLIFVNGFTELFEQINYLLNNNTFDVIIHSMAVSDYSPALAFDVDNIFEYFNSNEIFTKKGLLNFLNEKNLMYQKKISSDLNGFMIYFNSNDKIIDLFKKIQPKSLLFGFKLLNSVSEEELVNVSTSLMNRSDADYIIANDLSQINATKHNALIISKNNNIYHLFNKVEIADKILEIIEESEV